jgi:excisionase family DNA binding protein
MTAYVSLSEAARLAGISRSTLYERIKKGEISTTRSHHGKPTVQISELIRVFGDALQLPDGIVQFRTGKSDTFVQVPDTLAGQYPDRSEQHRTAKSDSLDRSEQQVRTLSAQVVQLQAELAGLRLVLAAKEEVIEAQRSAQQRLDAQLEIAQAREKMLLLEGPVKGRNSFWKIFGK